MSESLLGPRAVRKFKRLNKIGEGTYAIVYQGRDVTTNRLVAIKKIKITKLEMGLDISAIREIKTLREIRHQNIIELIDVFMTSSNLNLILEYLTSDLEMIINDKSIVFSSADVKSWMMMTLNGVHHLHSHFILHRDLKPNNLLIAPDGVLKIADFGLARDFAAAGTLMTPTVVTRWYRAPELLYGARQYGTGIDIWSVGCIFAELMLRAPFLPGNTDLGQIDTIVKALGEPSLEEWPELKHFDAYAARPVSKSQQPMNQAARRAQFEHLFSAARPDELDLLQQMLTFNPSKRPSAKATLQSAFFQKLPRPTPPNKLPKKGGSEGISKVASNLKRLGDSDLLPPDRKRIVARKLVFE